MSHLDDIDLMIVRFYYERDASEFDDLARRPYSPKYESLNDDDFNSNSNSRENYIWQFIRKAQVDW